MAFEKEEKEVITREIISEKLIRRGRRDFFTYLLILLFEWGFLWATISLEISVVMSGRKAIIAQLLSAVFFIATGCGFALQIIRRAFRRWRAGITGAFTVSGDILACAQRRRLPFYRSTRYIRNELVITFVSGLVYRDGINSVAGVNEAGMRLNYTLSCSSPGDLFYVVTVDREPKTPIYLFPDALFTYREK